MYGLQLTFPGAMSNLCHDLQSGGRPYGEQDLATEAPRAGTGVILSAKNMVA